MSGAWEINENPEVVLGIPYQGNVSMDWALAFKNLMVPNTLYSVAYGQPIDVARNSIAKRFLESNAEYLMFVDSDVVLPPDSYIRLKNRKLDIVSGLYYTKFGNYTPAMWYDRNPAIPITEYQNGELLEADLIGMGCCLIRRRVFENLEPPWFKWTQSFVENGCSEDFYFCRNAKARGFKVCVDTSIQTHHIGNGASNHLGFMSLDRIMGEQV